MQWNGGGGIPFTSGCCQARSSFTTLTCGLFLAFRNLCFLIGDMFLLLHFKVLNVLFISLKERRLMRGRKEEVTKNKNGVFSACGATADL